jgi:hypothetical protein
MYVSSESSEQTNARLRRVISEASFVVYPGEYAFREYDVATFPASDIATALAFVRDSDVWSALVPSALVSDERFAVFSFHFTPGLDNSGFVGWLASHLKATIGTGVFVVCGQNSSRGGIFDYWGAPLSVAARVIDEIKRLRDNGTSV